MSEKYEDLKFKKWLDVLQQESWQLELIISGVAILGLFQIIEPIGVFVNSANAAGMDSDVRVIVGLFMGMIMLSIMSLIVCLIIHVILRGLWIGAVGLRYFSGDIDYEKLRYADRFSVYLKHKIGSFDKYISKLEDYCSLMFAISFLLVFFFISFFVSLGFIIAIQFVVEALFGNDNATANFLGISTVIIFAIAYLLTAIDFFTQGFLKKKKWTSVFYLPVYRIMSRITLSFLYRPLLYNLLDNKLGKRILALLIPIFITLVVLTSLGIKESNFLTSDWNDSSEYAYRNNYEDEMVDAKSAFVQSATIPSKIITSSSLPIFIKHRPAIEDAILKIDSTLVPEYDHRGLDFSGINLTFGNSKNEKDVTYNEFSSYVNTLPQVLFMQLDDDIIASSYTVTTNKKNQLGYETVVDLKEVNRGRHTLKIERKEVSGDSLRVKVLARIPFWYYPD